MSEQASNGTTGHSESQQRHAPAEAAAGRTRARHKAFATYALVAAGVVTAVFAIGFAQAGKRTSVAVVAAAPIKPAATEPAQPQAQPTTRPRVEMVFVLDTTSSMSGLIEGAKRKIWSLASFVAHGQPTPELRVGLVAFRDVGDAYVTRVHDLDDDLDRVYARLRRFRAEGGGDTPEHVARALDEAVKKMSWSDQQSVVKVIYLVGDAPPHTDYDDGYDLKKTARAAVDAGIAVHTIRCGDDAATEAVWRTVASIGHGQFMTVGQDGGMRESHTPFDDELARLHDRLSNTTIAYGAGAAEARAAVASAAAAPAEVKADRARFLSARRKAVGGRGDLVDDVVSGKVAVAAVPRAELPPALANMDQAELEATVATRDKERREISARIDELTAKREAHLDKAAKAAASAGERDGFDAAAKAALRKSVRDKALAGFEL